MKGYNTQAVSHPFELDATQVLNDYNVTKDKAQLPFIIEDDGYVYVAGHGQSNMGGREPYSNPDGYIENFPYLSDLQIPDGLGGWKTVVAFAPKLYQPSLVICNHLIQKYGIKIRLYTRPFGGSSIVNWNPTTGANFSTIQADYTLLGSNVRPASLVLWSHGEANNTWDYATYAPEFYTWINGAIAAGFINSDYKLVLNEINDQDAAVTINTALKAIADENTNYAYVRTDGITQEDGLHWEGVVQGIVDFGRRYIKSLEALIFGFDKYPYLDRPTAPTVSLDATNANDVDISWTAATATEAGATIVGYRLVRGVSGTRFYKDVGNVTSANIPFTVTSGNDEKFSVFAKDSNGNYTPNRDLVLVTATRP